MTLYTPERSGGFFIKRGRAVKGMMGKLNCSNGFFDFVDSNGRIIRSYIG
jgi:hypothetical protein